MFIHPGTTSLLVVTIENCAGSILNSVTSPTKFCGTIFHYSRYPDALKHTDYCSYRYHTRAIRSLHFHPTYPLFASSSDDGAIQIFHARIYNDLLTDPLIVPLKILRGHTVKDGLGVLQVKWCNKQPWLVSAGADGNVAVWCS